MSQSTAGLQRLCKQFRLGWRQRGMKRNLIAGKCGLASLCLWFTTRFSGADPAFTIYNQNFAVIRETLPLDLKSGNDTVGFSGVIG